MRKGCWIAALAALVLPQVAASDYKLDWTVVSAGGGSMASASYRTDATAGQSAAGFVTGPSKLCYVGFWSGEPAAPVVIPTVAAAKLLPDGTLISVSGKIVTSDVGDFAEFFYIQEPDRASGIKVAVAPWSVTGLVRGCAVNVTGILATAGGERQIADPVVVVSPTAGALVPIGTPSSPI